MSWIATITADGMEALAAAVQAGTSLIIDTVKTSTAVTSSPASASAMSSVKDTGYIVRREKEGSAVKITCKVPPFSGDGYTLKEIGLFATDGTTSILFALLQNSDGVTIPAVEEFPDFSYKNTSIFQISGADSIEVTPDVSALVSQGDLDDAMDEKVDKDQGVANKGKFLVVGNDGKVALLTIENGSGVAF